MAAHGNMAGHDAEGAEVIEPIPMPGDAAAADAQARDAEYQKERNYLLTQKPIIARSNDAAAIAKYNTRLAAFARKSKASDGSYSRVAEASAAARVKPGSVEAPNYEDMDAAYKARLHGQKEVTN
jgi:hypothetical protein